MTKSTVTKIFIGSLFAIAGGVVLLAAGLFLAYVNGTFVMRGPDVVGIHPSAFTWSMAGLALVGTLAVVGGALAASSSPGSALCSTHPTSRTRPGSSSCSCWAS